MPSVTLRRFEGLYATVRLPAGSAIPSWADGDGFVSISRTPDELSVVCRSDRVQDGMQADMDWRCWQFAGPFAFSETGIAAAVLAPLAEAGIGVFLVSTYDTDYLLVKAANATATEAALTKAGHRIQST
jgi:hypothetical protein